MPNLDPKNKNQTNNELKGWTILFVLCMTKTCLTNYFEICLIPVWNLKKKNLGKTIGLNFGVSS